MSAISNFSSSIFNWLLAALLFAFPAYAQQRVTSHVNPFIGTDGHGHTWPGAGYPFGMVQLSPDTRVEGWDACGGYHYSDASILGFSHTHLSGTGVPDYGDILVMPISGDHLAWAKAGRLDRAACVARFRHEDESASPGYYGVKLATGIKAELTVTPRTGLHRYTFPAGQRPAVLFDLRHGLGPDVVTDAAISVTGMKEVSGYRFSTGWAKNQRIYFVAQFSAFIVDGYIYRNSQYVEARDSARGTDVAAVVRFDARTDSPLLVRVGISTVSIDNARRNLEAEQPRWNFDATRRRADQAWEHELRSITVEGGTPDQLSTFYTALYHAMLTPNLASDCDGRYRGMDGRVHTAAGYRMYSVFSLWDTFRAEHPLLTIIDPARSRDFVLSLLAKYRESGVLPVWELASNETWCMIGYHAVSVIADAWMKGIRGFNPSTALRAMKHSAALDHFGLDAYRRHGFIPGESESESVSKTLEYAYDDWCIARFAASIGASNDARTFFKRSQYYRNVFDPVTGFMRPRMNGGWVAPFDPAMVTNHFTEANSWQYSFFAPHDVTGLMSLMGGRARFVTKLDSLFATMEALTGRQQSDITGLIGQYAQGNEPSHHAAYLYNFAGAPWKTQRIVRIIMDSLYRNTPAGLCGNDDCGQMSAWYVMSAMGLYQVTPGKPEYCIGSPLFKKITINAGTRRAFTIAAPTNGPGRPYIHGARLNGAPHTASFLTHDAIVRGGRLELDMESAPDTAWASAPKDCPATSVTLPFTQAPVISAANKVFRDSLVVSMASDGMILYTLDGRVPDLHSSVYRAPIVLHRSCAVTAAAVGRDGSMSKTTSAAFLHHIPVGTLALGTRYKPQYAAGGDDALIDGILGAGDFRSGAWQGYEGDDIIATIDLGATKSIDSVTAGFLQDNNAWIFFPTRIEVSYSPDGGTFSPAVQSRIDVDPVTEGTIVRRVSIAANGAAARFVRLRAVNMGRCPAWHKGAGGPAWLFSDEIQVYSH